MRVPHIDKIDITLPAAALGVIFDECDLYDRDETGGRIVGTFKQHGDHLTIDVRGIIDPGPKARRSPVMLFQDGEHQEKIFRKIEEHNPEIEHLGTWHTHHVNGLQTLSGGDISTYTRTVNHKNQNTPFFYALLVVGKNDTENPSERYDFKPFIFFKGGDGFYEIPARHVRIVDVPLLWPSGATTELKPVQHAARQATVAYRHVAQAPGHSSPPQLERVYDRDILAEFYGSVRPFTSPKLGFYWRGPVELLDGSKVEAVLVEDSSGGSPSYSLVLRGVPKCLKSATDALAKQEFPSARVALISVERLCNRVLFEQSGADKKTEGY
jgi:hypothetical protein